jgi:hypothetical protein
MPIENLASFERFLKQQQQVVMEVPLKAKKRMVSNVFHGVVAASPVADPKLWKKPREPKETPGRFRASWRVANGNVDSSVEPTSRPFYPVPGQEVLQPVLSAMNAEMPTYISNSLPYARRLNHGWSKQAPSGFVQRAVERARAKLFGGIA